MGNQRPEKQLADFESGMISEESPDCEDLSQILDEGIQINNNGESFTADITGPDMDLGTLGSVPKLSVSVSLPPGLSLGDFSSNSGLSTVDEIDGRQIKIGRASCRERV